MEKTQAKQLLETYLVNNFFKFPEYDVIIAEKKTKNKIEQYTFRGCLEVLYGYQNHNELKTKLDRINKLIEIYESRGISWGKKELIKKIKKLSYFK